MTQLLERVNDGLKARRLMRPGVLRRSAIYVSLLFWAFVALFPIYWTFTTSLKTAFAVTRGQLIPWFSFEPSWQGWRTLGLTPSTIGAFSTVRAIFAGRFFNSVLISSAASTAAMILGSLAAYGLSRFNYKFAVWRNDDILFFFLSQMIMPPVVMAMPLLLLYKELALLDTRVGMVMVYTLMVLPIVIWIMRDQFEAIPRELEEAASIDGATIWGTFIWIVVPIAFPGMVASFVLSLILCWNEYFLAALLTSSDAQTLPVMVASQTGSQGIEWWTMAAISTTAIVPIAVVGVLLERYVVKGLATGAVK